MSDSYSSPDPYAPTGSGGYGTAGSEGYGPQGTAPQPYGPPPGAPQPYGPPPGTPQPYGWPGGTYAYGPPPQPQGTNGFAVAGLVLGILPVLAGIPGIVFGAIGLRQIKRTGQNGRGMALTGVILGSLWLALIAGLVTVGIVAGSGDQSSSSASPGPVYPSVYPTPSSSSSAGSSGGDSESAFQVKVGDCLRTTPSGEVRSVDLVSCSRPHAVEAYADFDLPGSSFPGDSRVSSLSQSGCKTRFPGFVGTTYDQSSLDVYFLHPTEQSWTVRHDREVLCLVGSDNKQTTGTLRNAHH